MKKFFLAIIIISSCNAQKEDLSKKAVQEIMAADKACNDMAAKEGFLKALIAYSDDSIVKPKDGELPVIGKNNLVAYYANKPETKGVSWVTTKAEAAQSGELGYSLGNWKFVTKDTTYYGNYCSIWKKQKDGTWKFVYDGGTNTPAPGK